MTNLLNPKMVLFTIALLPQFVSPALGHVTLQFAVLGATFIAFEIAIDGTVGLAAGRVTESLVRGRWHRRIERASGCVFIALGARLAADR
jgi:threonine/homoserine/homoserine lactone efflux protein